MPFVTRNAPYYIGEYEITQQPGTGRIMLTLVSDPHCADFNFILTREQALEIGFALQNSHLNLSHR